MVLAAAAYPIESHATWAALTSKLAKWVANAAQDGADIAALPEYAGLEAAFAEATGALTTKDWCLLSAECAGRYAALCATLAQRHGIILLGGTLPARVGQILTNRAFLCLPNGRVIPIDKQVLTPWEQKETTLSPGPSLPRVVAGGLSLATLICYDSEFPPLSHSLAPDILLIPSCTEAAAGDTRLRIAARARALELQAVTAHAPLLGAVRGCDIVDANTGRAGIYAPPDSPFPSNGILAQGAVDQPGWVFATVEKGVLSHTRTSGAVAPRAHMQSAAARAARATARIAK